MPARALCLEHNVGITLLSQVGVHEPTPARAVLGSRNDAVVTLVDQVLKFNTALLEHATDRPRAVLRGLLILAKSQQQGALVLPTVRQRILNRLENACDLILHVDSAATPNVGAVHMSAKGGVRPVGLGTRHHGDHVHVAHEHDGFEGGVGTAKRHQQRMADKLDLARPQIRAARPAAYTRAGRRRAASPPPRHPCSKWSETTARGPGARTHQPRLYRQNHPHAQRSAKPRP